MKTTTILKLFIIFLFSLPLSAQKIYTIGPMFHINFGHKMVKTSWGIEAAVWEFSGKTPYGFDIGVEWQKPKFRIYTEAQTGLVFVGTSAGIGCEFQKEYQPKVFLQGSVWANAFIGIDIRFRTKKEDFIAPGAYVKIPFIPGGVKEFNEEYEKNHPNENSNGNEIDEDDWDWLF